MEDKKKFTKIQKLTNMLKHMLKHMIKLISNIEKFWEVKKM